MDKSITDKPCARAAQRPGKVVGGGPVAVVPHSTQLFILSPVGDYSEQGQ